MRHGGVIICLALLGGVLAAASSQSYSIPASADAVVSDRFSSPYLGEVRLIGVCDVLSPTVQCWDDQGQPNVALADQTTEAFTKGNQTFGNNPAQIRFRFRHKVRVAIFQTQPASGGARPVTTVGGFYNSTNSYLQEVSGVSDPRKNPNLQYVLLDCDPSAPATSIFMRLDHWTGHAVNLPMHRGAQGTLEGQTITVGSIRAIDTKGTPEEYLGNRKIWDVLVKISGDSANSKIQYSVQALDGNGAGFFQIDQNGQPIKMPPGRSFGYSGPGVNTPFAGPYSPDLGGRIWRCFVDPKYVGKLSIDILRQQTVEFQNVPLDPRH